MKMLQTGIVAKAEALGDSGGRAVVVGVKLDTPSRELLTWALVKVAQPGDLVVALHVLGNDGKREMNSVLFLSLNFFCLVLFF